MFMQKTNEPDDLIRRICDGDQPVQIPIPASAPRLLSEMISEGIMPVLFLATEGGMEIDLSVDKERTTIVGSGARYAEAGTEVIGYAILNEIPLRVRVWIDLSDMCGKATVEVVSSLDSSSEF